jgi:cellulose synthase/poly-beta-1,6-N-acetylglucosamine synthase-like glycosyltransferase
LHVLADVLTLAQTAILVGLAVFGLHRGYLVWLHLRTRRKPPPSLAAVTTWPTVTVQLPLYNEPGVARRLLLAVAALDYPRRALHVQVLDDSTDETSAIVASTLAMLPADLDVVHLRRGNRAGYKAGALAHGLAHTDGELIAIFDADFVPPRAFLRQLVPMFVDPKLGMVQARWEHLNPAHSLLTALQRLLLDGHFVIEHGARAATGRFFNFNGTAGIFRRACITDAGGWQHDTLTEDLDLSYRAQLAGWRFAYRPDVACPAELPVRMTDFLSQQHRWAKGAVQTARKMLPALWRAPLPVRTKVEASFHLLGNAGFLLLLGLMLVTLPLQTLRYFGHGDVPVVVRWLEGVPLVLSLLCVLAHYGVAQASLGRWHAATCLRLPCVLALGAGMTLNATAAVIAGCAARTGEFKRTPKVGTRSVRQLGRNGRGLLPWLEVALALWCATSAALSLAIEQPWTAAFHALFALGLGAVGVSSLLDEVAARTSHPTPAAELEPST